MTKEEIEGMAVNMTDQLVGSFGAQEADLKQCVRSWLMEAIRETEDEAKAIAYEAINRIGQARKQTVKEQK